MWSAEGDSPSTVLTQADAIHPDLCLEVDSAKVEQDARGVALPLR